MEKAQTYISNYISRKKPGEIIFTTDFRGAGTDAAIRKSLSRLSGSGKLKRIAHGIYYIPKTDPLFGELNPSQMQEMNNEYRELMKKNDETSIEALREKANSLMEKMNGVYKAYVAKNPKSPIALYAINEFAGSSIDAKEVEPLFNAIPEKTKASRSGQDLARRIDAAKKTAIGTVAMDFTQNDTLGNPVSLSSFRGKYVLIDFWASWCVPCRQENPHVVAAFQKYKDKGFTVLGISLDQGTPDKWLEAIHKDNLTWTQLSDLQGWNNAVSRQYGIRSIPQNLLIDPDGVIIAKNLRGEKLAGKLSEILK